MRPAAVTVDVACHLTLVRRQHPRDLEHGPAGSSGRTRSRGRTPARAGLPDRSRPPHRPATPAPPPRVGPAASRHGGGPPRRHRQAHELPHGAPRRRDPRAPGRPRPPHRPGAAGPPRRQPHDDLPPRPEPGAGRGAEPGGPDGHPVTCHAACEPKCAGIGCRTLQPIPIVRERGLEVEGSERQGQGHRRATTSTPG